jgi:glycosyltransferase involved in cell wall biosynthesis
MPERKRNKRILIVISQIHKAISHEWVAEELRIRNYDVHFALLNSGDSEMEQYLVKNHFSFVRITYRNKYDIPLSILRLRQYIRKEKIEIVHAHLFEGGLIGMIAAKLSGVRKRIYTRHHSTFHQSYFPGMVKYDRLICAAATKIIATSEVVKETLIAECVPEQKIKVIHHGFKLAAFDLVSPDRVLLLKKKYHVEGNPVIGVIARWTEWKGIQFIIPAFRKLLTKFPNAILMLANSSGEYETTIIKQLSDLPEKNYRIIKFEEDFMALYKLFDIFIHVPINEHAEAFGQVYVEALASGIPSIFTLSGIANEFVIHEKNALVVPFESSNAIYECLLRLLSEHDLTSRLVNGGREAVNQKFRLQTMIEKFEALYTYHS